MTTTTLTASAAPARARQAAATLVWLGSAYTTMLAVIAMKVHIDYALWAALGVQAVLTMLESRIWQGKGGVLEWIALGIDVLVNMGGTWQWVKHIDQTPPWQMLRETLGAPERLSSWTLLGIALVIAVLLAYSPEGIWRQR